MHHVYAFVLCKSVNFTYSQVAGVSPLLCVSMCVSVCYFRTYNLYLGEIKNELKKIEGVLKMLADSVKTRGFVVQISFIQCVAHNFNVVINDVVMQP